jgi:hypothetical protein
MLCQGLLREIRTKEKRYLERRRRMDDVRLTAKVKKAG